MKKFLSCIFCVLLASCSHQSMQLQFNQQGLQKLAGMPVEDVYKKLGEPQKSFSKDGKTFLVYTTTYQNYTMPVSQTYNNPGMQIEAGVPGEMGFYSPQECTTVFTVISQVVQSVDTVGNCL